MPPGRRDGTGSAGRPAGLTHKTGLSFRMHIDDDTRLRHMRDAALEAIGMCRDIGRRDIEENRQLGLALVKLVEIIGEAANHVSEETQAHLPIDFRDIIRMRHRLVHGYFSIDYDILWDTIQQDLPVLAEHLAFLDENDGSVGSMSGGPG